MSRELMHDLGMELEKWFQEMEQGARKPDPADALLFESAAFKNARPGTEH
jgi:hypothetical protein